MITERQLLAALERLFETTDLLAVEPFHRRVMYFLDEAVAQNLVSARRAAQYKEQVNKHVQTLWAQKHEAIYAEREAPRR
ncbi:MAG: hypothetical protein ABR599_01070 [Gemmatimonadota bacterium]